MKIHNRFKKIFLLMRQVDLRLSGFILPCAFSVAAGLSEAVNLALLLPLAKGLIEGNFTSFSSIPWIQHILLYFTLTSKGWIFICLVGLVFVTAVAKSAFEYFSNLFVCKQIRSFSNNLRKFLYARFLSFGKSYFDQNSAGIIQQQLIGYTNKIALDFRDYQQVFTLLVQLVVYMGILFYISPKLTFFVLFIFPFLHYSVDWLIKKITHTSVVYADALGAMSKNSYNILSAVSLVKAYHSEDFEKKKFAELSNEVERLEYSVDKKQSLAMPMQEVLLLCIILLLIVAIAFLTRHEGPSHISAYLVYFYVLKKLSNHFRSLNYARVSFASSRGLWEAIFTLSDDKDKYCVKEGTNELKGFKNEIRVSHLNFGYRPEITVIKDCSFTVKKGEMTALVGETGAGKSTVVKLIARFYDIPAESIFIDGVDVNEYTFESYYRQIAYVPQEALITNDTFRRNLLYGLQDKATGERISKVLQDAHLDELVRNLPDGLETVLGDHGVRLSGGERQRLSIARAMLKNTDILILDEATSSLDSQTEKIIQVAMEELIKGKTSIVIAHRFSTIKHADKIIVMENGEAVESGRWDELIERKGRFYHFWQAQKFY